MLHLIANPSVGGANANVSGTCVDVVVADELMMPALVLLELLM